MQLDGTAVTPSTGFTNIGLSTPTGITIDNSGQGTLTPATGDTGRTRWWINEFGAALAIVNIVLALYIWHRQREKPGSLRVCGM